MDLATMDRKRLRVEGFPTDIPTARAKDKITIHFLRSRNGGGEVESVDIIQGNPAYAIVLFEKDEVVENVLKIKDHPLKVNDKIYNLVVSEITGKVELDEVIEKLAMTVNFRKFPENNKNLLKILMQTHKFVTFDIDEKSMTCNISGLYGDILTLAQEILRKLGIVYTIPKQTSADILRKSRIERRNNYPEPLGMAQASEYQYVPLSGTAVEELYSEKTVETEEQLQEPFVWDSDIYIYIQKFHLLEYQEILNSYHILAAVDNLNDITTIYLETVSWGKTYLGDLRSARSKLMGLYRGLELLLRKEQINKRNVHGDQHFYRTLSIDLERLYPMLLFHEDDRYLYLIGNMVDVSHGKQYIMDLHAKIDRMSGDLDKQFGANGASNVSQELSPTYENIVGRRIATSFNDPTTHSANSAKSHLEEKYLVSSASPRRRLQDRAKVLGDKTSLKSTTANDFKNDEELPRPDEKYESMTMPSVRRRDVPQVLKIVREDIRNSGATSKPTGLLKPVQFTKASSELPYSSLVDLNPPSMDFPEGKPRRSSSLSRVYSEEKFSPEQQSETMVYKDEVNVANWQWHYMTQINKSDIDSWCSEVELTEERKKSGKVTLKLKAFNKNKLAITKEMIQLMCWKLDINIIRSSFDYATLGVQGPEDSALVEWCDLFCKCSAKLSVKLEKDKLVLLYPKEIRPLVLEEYGRHAERKMKSSKDVTMPDDGQSTLQDKFESSAKDAVGDYIAEQKPSLEDKWLTRPKHESSSFVLGDEEIAQKEIYQASKHLADQKYSLVGEMEPFQGVIHEYEDYLTIPVQGFPDEKSPNPKELFEDTKNRSTSEKTEKTFYTSTEAKTYDHSPYTSELIMQGKNFSPPNVQAGLEAHYGEQGIASQNHAAHYEGSAPQVQIPAVGLESDMVDSICSQCMNMGKTVQTSSGQVQCVKCFAESIICALNIASKATLRASMTHTTMSLRLPGYEHDTSVKIIYEVSDGVQGAGDPQPGCQYKGGKFEAYLPDNREGRKLLSLLQRALDQGLLFQIKTFETGEQVTWYRIPHKTSPDGGKSKNGYPDSTYIKTTITLLNQHGIE